MGGGSRRRKFSRLCKWWIALKPILIRSMHVLLPKQTNFKNIRAIWKFRFCNHNKLGKIYALSLELLHNSWISNRTPCQLRYMAWHIYVVGTKKNYFSKTTSSILHIFMLKILTLPISLLVTFIAYFCLVLTFANIFDTDQAQQHVGPALDPSCWHFAGTCIPVKKYVY